MNKEKSYDFFLDEKVTIWNRTFFHINAKNLKEAKIKAKEQFDSGQIENEYNFETLYETEISLNPENNGGRSTKELFYNNKLIKTNVRKRRNRTN